MALQLASFDLFIYVVLLEIVVGFFVIVVGGSGVGFAGLNILSDHDFLEGYVRAGCTPGVLGCGGGEGWEALAWLGEGGEVFSVVRRF